MTKENQNIDEDFFEGNYKKLSVAVWTDEALSVEKDLSGAEITYAIFNDDNELLLVKSSNNGDTEIKIISTNDLEVYLNSPDSIGLAGTHNHMLNVVDAAGKEETIFTGRVRIFMSHAFRIRNAEAPAYLEGG
jgi:hypothetical protein